MSGDPYTCDLQGSFCLFDSRYAQPVDLEIDSVDPAAERVQQLVENQKILHRFPVDVGARPVLDRLLELVSSAAHLYVSVLF
jgi:hypothetical protein